MNEEYDLTTLSERTRIDLRKLRYCVDHELVPERGWFVAKHDVGRRRQFDRIAAVSTVCAALLLEAGVKRDAVRSIIGTLELMPGRRQINPPMVADALIGRLEGSVDVADGTHARWQVGGRDSGWMKIGRFLRRDPEFQPKVVITLHLSRIRRLVVGSKA